MPKQLPLTCLNDYLPIALTPTVMKYSERLVFTHIKATTTTTILDHHLFAYHSSRLMESTVFTVLFIGCCGSGGTVGYVLVRRVVDQFSS